MRSGSPALPHSRTLAAAGRILSHPFRVSARNTTIPGPVASTHRRKPHSAPGPARFLPAAQCAGQAICTPPGDWRVVRARARCARAAKAICTRACGPGVAQARACCARAGPGTARLSTTPTPTFTRSSAAIRHPAVCRPFASGSHCRRTDPCAIGACDSRTGHSLH